VLEWFQEKRSADRSIWIEYHRRSRDARRHLLVAPAVAGRSSSLQFYHGDVM
jgi:hypothetical protein